MSKRIFARLLTLVATLPLLFTSIQATAATFSVTAESCVASPGGYQWAVEQANNTPGRDTISIDVPRFWVYDCVHPDPASDLPIAITESVDIIGNGNTADASVAWVNPDGTVNDINTCPAKEIVWANLGGALLDVGVRGTDSSGIDVTINGLNMIGLTTVGYVRENATLTIEDSELRNIFSVRSSNCLTAILTIQDGADLTLKNTEIYRANVPGVLANFAPFPAGTELIIGGDGDLVMENVLISGSGGKNTVAVSWYGGSVKVVSSSFLESNGFILGNTTMDFVNSVFQMWAYQPARFRDNFILMSGSVLTSRASTFYWESIACPNCLVTKGSGSDATKGLGFVGYPSSGYGLPSVRFESTALGSFDFFEDPLPLQKLWGDPRVFSSDAYTWVQPTDGQDAVELAAILPNASTTPPGLIAQASVDILLQRYPIVPGVLVEAVPDAGAGGVNELLNPIDGSPITLDINGLPRVYANGTRNIGAVQNSDAPILSATSGDSEVSLGWSPTPAGQSGGYEVCTSSTLLTDPLTGPCPGTPTSAGPTETSKVISSLTNGDPYWFAMRDNAGIWSRVATATPMGPLGIAQPTATTIGDGSVQVFWAEPATTGGFKGLVSYQVFFRPFGTQTWLSGPKSLTARTTLLPGLVNGTTYEIGIMAQTDDGGLVRELGTITATPEAAPTLSYATPSNWPQNTPITLTATVAQLQGAGAYTIESGALPTGLSLEPSTGVISGTPTIQQSISATVRLTDGTTGLFTDAIVPLTIVAPSPSPQIWYPTIQAAIGIGPVSATPTQSGIPDSAVWSVYLGDSLPAGFTIDPATGVISGTPTTSPGQVVAITIQACWDSCDPNAEEVRLAPMKFYIVPNLQYPANTQATVGVAATVTPTVSLWSGGMFSIESGSLPAGMNLDPVTGAISGTPETLSSSTLTIRYSTGVNVTIPPLEYVYATMQINVAHPTITLTYPAVTANVGESLSVSPTVTGLTGTTVYSIISGALPQGLSLNPATGAISGVPTDTPGSFPVVIEVTGPYGSQRTNVVIFLKFPKTIWLPIIINNN